MQERIEEMRVNIEVKWGCRQDLSHRSHLRLTTHGEAEPAPKGDVGLYA
jgi:hypothetical protein